MATPNPFSHQAARLGLARPAQAVVDQFSCGQSTILAMNSRFHGGLQPRYAWRVTFNGRVIITTDPIEVARIRRAFPSARVEIVPYRN